MPVTRVSDPDTIFKKSFHRRNDSGELDVFEAAGYFSGYNEAAASYNCATFNQRVMGRASLDIPMRNPLPQQVHHVVEKQLKDKKYKQPSSPGGRLASFLNSLFNQTGSKKKKSKSTATTTRSMKDEQDGRRKRRSSISHFGTTTDTKSFYPSSSSGFRTPPPYAHTPAKSCKEFRSYSDHKLIGPTKPTSLQNAAIDDKRWLDEKLKFNNGNSGKRENVGARHPSEEKEIRKFNESDDGADSDSSSDLFELRNYDLGIYSSGLPVYETAHIDTIKRGAPISNGSL